ncbi:MAG: hypothetical protein WD187_01010 [Candidatus Woykebacteria bacterium]
MKLLFSVFDTLALFFALTIAILVGGQFQPNPIVFLILFPTARALAYKLWFEKVAKQKVPWLRISVQTIILIVFIPIVVATSGFVLPSLQNNVFLFLVVPIVGTITALVLHRIYNIS